MLVSVLQNRLKPIWPSLYHQLKVASHQDGPSMVLPSPAGESSSPPSAAPRVPTPDPMQPWPPLISLKYTILHVGDTERGTIPTGGSRAAW